MFLPTIIFRHQRENLKKCSLSGLENNPQFKFFTYPIKQLPLLKNYCLLSFEGPVLTNNDAQLGIVLLDGTWRYAKQMEKNLKLPSELEIRSLPAEFCTAYPRRQHDCPLPQRGLSSIEALYVASLIQGKDVDKLLNRYYWKEEFLKKNEQLINQILVR